MRSIRPEQRTLILIGLAVITLTALAGTIATRSYHALLLDAFHERSIAYVQAFVSSTQPWLDPSQPEMLTTASRLLLVGSALFVQITLDGDMMVDVRAPGLSLDPLPDVAVSASVRSTPRRTAEQIPYLDVVVPIVGASPREAASYGRIGIDRSTVLAQIRTTTLLVAGLALLFDVLVLGAVGWAFLRPRLLVQDSKGQTREGTQLIAGPLRIDLETKNVMLAETPVSLTPKQFALLSFLAERMDRVCSDREILDVVWADSPYADAKDVKQYIYLVRRRLAKIDPHERERIKTVPGFGYKLTSGPINTPLTDD